MNNKKTYIPSGDVGEIYLNIIDKYWHMYDSTYFVKEKRIAFIKFLIDLVGVRARYRSNQFELERRGDLPHMILDIMKSSAKII